MFEVIKIKFNFSPNQYYYSTNLLNLKKGDKVITETDGGLEIGICSTNMFKEKKENLVLPLKKIVRLATIEDIKQDKKNKEDAKEALNFAKKQALKLKLNMHFIGATYTFDRNQLFFSYLSEERVDFRELAKKLAQRYKVRIELRQVGVRDKAKMIGGLGPCGLSLCCNSFLTDFNSVSINMAKNQFLALNPSKINGVCGRLLCCLNYEDEVYTELKQDFPRLGSIVKTSSGEGKVVSINIFDKTYNVEIDKNNIVEETIGRKND